MCICSWWPHTQPKNTNWQIVVTLSIVRLWSIPDLFFLVVFEPRCALTHFFVYSIGINLYYLSCHCFVHLRVSSSSLYATDLNATLHFSSRLHFIWRIEPLTLWQILCPSPQKHFSCLMQHLHEHKVDADLYWFTAIQMKAERAAFLLTTDCKSATDELVQLTNSVCLSFNHITPRRRFSVLWFPWTNPV